MYIALPSIFSAGKFVSAEAETGFRAVQEKYIKDIYKSTFECKNAEYTMRVNIDVWVRRG